MPTISLTTKKGIPVSGMKLIKNTKLVVINKKGKENKKDFRPMLLLCLELLAG
ncbi:Uncharacterised protein [uncultured archaeon]|nr:Uncharacterised protein [uncultured archaeon]